MKSTIAKLALTLIGAATLVAGCATSNQSAVGGMGDEYETGQGGSTSGYLTSRSSAPNGSISIGNPFGADSSGR